MAHSFLGMPLTEITERVVEGDLVLNRVFLEMREQLLEKQSVPAMFLTAEKMLSDEFRNKLVINPLVEFAVNSIVANPAQVTIKSIAHKTGYSPRHFIETFSSHVGVNPKSFLRILRFQKAINEIQTRGNINWIALADECGYYDQAHLIANFKEFSGFTPVQYIENTTGEWLNYVPVA